MAENFDVIVVGARCAGSPVAASLAARGLRVCLLDRARFPSDVPSTHLVQPSGVECLKRLGVLERVLATGAPPLDRCTFAIDDVRLDADSAIFERLGAPALCVRRVSLDSLLVQAAEQAGAEVRTQTPVVGLVEEDGVVRGVRTDAGTLRAALVVGADGPQSAVARFVGAREYHVTDPGRLFLWAYFEHAAEPHGHARLGKMGDLGYLAMPTDNGLFMAALAPSMSMRHAYTTNVEGGFARGLASIDELAEVLRLATRIGPIRVMARWHGYFRESTGPGWVLVGDAGHFKDPTPGQGISDALRQAERLVPAIEAGFGHGDLGDRLRAWERWRDDDAMGMYWFAGLMGAAGPNPGIVTEALRSLSRHPQGAEQFMRVLNHDVAPLKVFGPRRVLRALIGSAFATPRALPRLLCESGSLLGEQGRRRRLTRHPKFVARPHQSGSPEPAAERTE